MQKQKLDIILPAYKPKGEWVKRVQEQTSAIAEQYSEQLEVSLIISPDGSFSYYSEEVKKQIESLPWRVRYVSYEKNRGKGFALRSGVEMSDADFILYTDYDFPFEPYSYVNVIESLLSGSDAVIAIRRKSYQQRLPVIRKLLSYGSHIINRVVLGLPYTDTQGGLKGFNRQGKEAFLKTNIDSFLFDTQFISIAVRKGLKVDGVPAKVRDEVVLSRMGMKVLLKELRVLPKVFKSRWFS
ncbi:MAG: glycosyltransferase [Porphyromonas sp.]|nr:glycosyltransferase [Porphyromonas sp.]